MAVNVDTVYQRVLAIANKEQRGYITPQEFNLFANQAQMNIFEQYFYDTNQFSRIPGNESAYYDMVTLLEEKISIFKKRHQPITITNEFGDGTLPVDIYRLGTVLRFGLTGDATPRTAEIEEVSESEYLTYSHSPLAAPSKQRPVYTRTSASTIKIYPSAGTTIGDQTKAAVVFFQQTGVAAAGSNEVNMIGTSTTTSGANVGRSIPINSNTNIKVGMSVSGTNIAVGTLVSAVISAISVTLDTLPTSAITTGTTLTFSENNNAFIESGQAITNSGWAGGKTVVSSYGYEGSTTLITTTDCVTGGTRALVFASDDIKCNYVRKPIDIAWGYTTVNSVALYDSSTSVNSELHESEETSLVIRVLALAGISIKDTSIYQIATAEENKKIQQEKQ